MSMIDGGDVVINVVGNLQQLNKDMSAAESMVRKRFGNIATTIGTTMTAAGAAITGTLGVIAKKFSEQGDALEELSQRTGFGVEALSELGYAAEKSGTNLGGLEAANRKLAKAIMDSADGTGAAADALGKLGLTYQDLAGLKPEDQFLKVAYAVAGIKDPTERSSLALQVFGKQGTMLLPMLEGGAKGLDEMRARAHELGAVWTPEKATAAAKFADTMLDLRKSMEGFVIAIGPAVVDILIPLIEWMIKGAVGVSNFAKEHAALTQVIVGVTGAFGALATTVGPFLIMLPKVAAGLVLVKAGTIGAAIAMAEAAGPAGPIALTITMLSALVLSITGAIDAWQKYKAATALAEETEKIGIGTNKLLQQTIDEHVARLREQGVELDATVLAQTDLQRTAEYLANVEENLAGAAVQVTGAHTELGNSVGPIEMGLYNVGDSAYYAAGGYQALSGAAAQANALLGGAGGGQSFPAPTPEMFGANPFGRTAAGGEAGGPPMLSEAGRTEAGAGGSGAGGISIGDVNLGGVTVQGQGLDAQAVADQVVERVSRGLARQVKHELAMQGVM